MKTNKATARFTRFQFENMPVQMVPVRWLQCFARVVDSRGSFGSSGSCDSYGSLRVIKTAVRGVSCGSYGAGSGGSRVSGGSYSSRFTRLGVGSGSHGSVPTVPFGFAAFMQ